MHERASLCTRNVCIDIFNEIDNLFKYEFYPLWRKLHENLVIASYCMVEVTLEIRIDDNFEILSLWLQDMWMANTWNYFQISVHCTNRSMLFMHCWNHNSLSRTNHCIVLACEYQICLYVTDIPSLLTHWGRVSHICVGKLTVLSSDNDWSPGRRKNYHLNQWWHIVNLTLKTKLQWDTNRNSCISTGDRWIPCANGQ